MLICMVCWLHLSTQYDVCWSTRLERSLISSCSANMQCNVCTYFAALECDMQRIWRACGMKSDPVTSSLNSTCFVCYDHPTIFSTTTIQQLLLTHFFSSNWRYLGCTDSLSCPSWLVSSTCSSFVEQQQLSTLCPVSCGTCGESLYQRVIWRCRFKHKIQKHVCAVYAVFLLRPQAHT